VQRTAGKRRKALIYLAVLLSAAGVFIADFFIKDFFRLNHPYESIPVIKNIFHLTVVFNRGAAFGILQGQTFFLIAVSMVLIVLFFVCFHKEEDFSFYNAIAYGLVMGGAASNLFDRLTLGYVVDYLDFRIWPVFNLADSCITIGVGLLILQTLRCPKKNAKPNNGRCAG